MRSWWFRLIQHSLSGIALLGVGEQKKSVQYILAKRSKCRLEALKKSVSDVKSTYSCCYKNPSPRLQKHQQKQHQTALWMQMNDGIVSKNPSWSCSPCFKKGGGLDPADSVNYKRVLNKVEARLIQNKMRRINHLW